MSKRGRPPVLDKVKQGQIVAIVSMGCSQRTAARYVRCSPSTIQNTAERDESFTEELEHARSLAVVTHMTNINTAAKKAQYWRAAAWALERLNPEEYAPPHPDTISSEQISRLMTFLAQIIVEAVPVSRYRKNILKRLADLDNMLSAVAPGKHEGAAKDVLVDSGGNEQ